MLSNFRKIYYRSPFFVQKLVFMFPKEWLFGKQYRYFLGLLKNGVILTDRRKETLALVYNLELPTDLISREINDYWPQISFIDKNLRFKYRRNYGIRSFTVETGGVTGKPANFIQNNSVWFKELAYIDYLFQHIGLKKDDLKLSFRGGEFGLVKDGLWYLNPLHREICFSPFSINKNSILILKRVLNKFKPKIWYGYPSVFKSLFTFLKSESVSLDFNPNTLLLISESFTKADVQFLKFHLPETRITSFYGLSERCAFGFPLAGDISGYKIDTNYSYVELVDDHGNVITEDGVLGEIVATTYDNDAMPLIRYRTGDYTRWKDYSRKHIGLIEGKWSGKSLIDVDGQKIPFSAINFHDDSWGDITLVQFRQVSPGLVTVSIDGVTFDIKQKLIVTLNKRVGKSIQFVLNPTNEFIKTKRGKTPLLVTNSSSTLVQN